MQGDRLYALEAMEADAVQRAPKSSGEIAGSRTEVISTRSVPLGKHCRSRRTVSALGVMS